MLKELTLGLTLLLVRGILRSNYWKVIDTASVGDNRTYTVA